MSWTLRACTIPSSLEAVFQIHQYRFVRREVPIGRWTLRGKHVSNSPLVVFDSSYLILDKMEMESFGTQQATNF